MSALFTRQALHLSDRPSIADTPNGKFLSLDRQRIVRWLCRLVSTTSQPSLSSVPPLWSLTYSPGTVSVRKYVLQLLLPVMIRFSFIY